MEQQRTADKGDSLPAKLLPTGNKGSGSGEKTKKDRTYGNFCGGTQKCPERNYGDVLCPAFFLVAFSVSGTTQSVSMVKQLGQGRQSGHGC